MRQSAFVDKQISEFFVFVCLQVGGALHLAVLCSLLLLFTLVHLVTDTFNNNNDNNNNNSNNNNNNNNVHLLSAPLCLDNPGGAVQINM